MTNQQPCGSKGREPPSVCTQSSMLGCTAFSGLHQQWSHCTFQRLSYASLTGKCTSSEVLGCCTVVVVEGRAAAGVVVVERSAAAAVVVIESHASSGCSVPRLSIR